MRPGFARRSRSASGSQSGHKLPIAENLLARDFAASAPNRVWVSDITYLWTRQVWLYLCDILDLWDRKVVGWSMGERLVADLAVDALSKTVALRRPPRQLNSVSNISGQGQSHFQKKMCVWDP